MKIEELKHEAQALVKERATLINFIANLEKQWEWIAEEKECVYCALHRHKCAAAERTC